MLVLVRHGLDVCLPPANLSPLLLPHVGPGLPSGPGGEARQHPRASEVVMQKPAQSFSRRRQLEERARLMRASPSWPEQVLFGAIRGGRVGVCVKRQVVIGCYIADFAVASRKLVIEVDGPHHALQCRSAPGPRASQVGVAGLAPGCRPWSSSSCLRLCRL